MAGVKTSDPWVKADQEVQKMLEDSKAEDKRLADAFRAAEKREVLPGVTMQKLIDGLACEDKPGAADLWHRMCQTEQGRKILFHLYTQLNCEHSTFARFVADRAKDVALSLEGVNATPETQDEIEEAESYVSDIQTAADEIKDDVYRAQVCNAPFAS